jgi:hypothetical protein
MEERGSTIQSLAMHEAFEHAVEWGSRKKKEDTDVEGDPAVIDLERMLAEEEAAFGIPVSSLDYSAMLHSVAEKTQGCPRSSGP